MTIVATGNEMHETRPASAERAPVAAPVINSTCIDPISDHAWDELVATHPESTFFHSSAWAKVLHSTYGHDPVYHRFYRGSKLAAMLPMMEVRSALNGRRGVSLPFTDSCGPLYFGQADSSQAMFEHLVDVSRARNWKYFEVRGQGASLPGSSPSLRFYNHILDLTGGADDLMNQLASPVRRAIRKAGENGLVTEISSDLEPLLEFYSLHVLTRKRHGLPPQPISFFENIHKHVLKARRGFVVLARKGSRPVAGAVFFHAGKKAIYKFGASDASQQELRGNNLTMWRGIQTLAQRGFVTLDFGRTSLANEGLRRFKRSWGAREGIVEYTKFDTATQSWATSRDKASGFHNIIFRRMPTPLNRLAGELLYPHLD